MKQLFLLIFISIIFVSGCDKGSELLKDQTISPKILDTIEKIPVQFGDGNKMVISNKEQVRYIINQIRSFKFEHIDKPLSVGQHYFLDLGNEQYSSTGYLTIEATYYKVIDTDNEKVLQLNNFIINIGREKFPGLLKG